MTTDTQPLAPTDAEIWQLWMPMVRKGVADPVDFARAVLARWGQPAHSGEPVYAFRRKGLDDFCTCTEKRYAELSAKPNLFETRIFYTAPKPVVREPLTDEQILLLRFATSSLFHLFKRWDNKEIPHYQLMDEMGQVVEHVIQRTVAANGIKGGQHGAE